MRGSAAFRSAVAPGGVLAGPWVKNALWRRARAVPSLDLRFAENKSLVNATTGQNLVTFTRSSRGTYVDSQGVIRTATTNLLLRSEEFGTTWTTLNASVSADQILAPNGTLTADKLLETASTGAHYVTQAVSALTGVYTVSVYIKASEVGHAMILMVGGTTQRGVGFNLSTGATYAEAIGGVSPPDIGASAVNIGDGWWRCRMTWTADGQTTLRIQTDSGTGTGSTTGTGTSGIYLWGAQLEQSSTVGEYIPTTSTINSAPRFDHNPTTGESLGLLVEAQRTNLLLLSENLYETGTGGGSWIYPSGVMSDNTQVAPDGTTTADTLTTTGGVQSIYQSATVTASTTYTGSVYVRLGTMQAGDFKVAVYNNSTPGFIAVDIAPSQTPTSTGWTRISYSFTTPVGCTSVRWYPFRNSVSLGSCTVHLWGAQLEAGALPTSYIPTTTATATRSADVASITGSNFSSWYRQDEGTIFSEFSAAAYSTASCAISDGTNNNRIMIDRGSTGTRYVITNAGVAQSEGAQTPYTLNSFVKTSLGYALDNCNLAAGGVLQILDTSASIPSSVDRLLLGVNAVGSGYGNGPIKRIAFWRSRLSDSTLASITQ